MQCRDRGQWHNMTIFELRNNMSYASQMQFEVLRRALCGPNQPQPQTIFDWMFWEKAARDPKMTAYLNHGVKAKMCEATPLVNSMGSQYVASRAQIEKACDSPSQHVIGLSDGLVHPLEESSDHICGVPTLWSTMGMRTTLTAHTPLIKGEEVHPLS